MRKIRIYHPKELISHQLLELDEPASRHLIQVLRKKVGFRFFIFNEKNGEFFAEIVDIRKKSTSIKIGESIPTHMESPLSIHLGQSISRGDRMDYAIQKATELGVFAIQPLITEFCQITDRPDKRLAHWQGIAISAAEQCGRCHVPKVYPPILFNDWIKKEGPLKIICAISKPTESGVPFTFSKKEDTLDIMLTIGPEGGFSDAEIQNAVLEKFQCLSLGPRILRTETATVVALTLLQAKWGDLYPIFTE